MACTGVGVYDKLNQCASPVLFCSSGHSTADGYVCVLPVKEQAVVRAFLDLLTCRELPVEAGSAVRRRPDIKHALSPGSAWYVQGSCCHPRNSCLTRVSYLSEWRMILL